MYKLNKSGPKFITAETIWFISLFYFCMFAVLNKKFKKFLNSFLKFHPFFSYLVLLSIPLKPRPLTPTENKSFLFSEVESTATHKLFFFLALLCSIFNLKSSNSGAAGWLSWSERSLNNRVAAFDSHMGQ